MGCECETECKCTFFVSKILDNIHEHITDCLVKSGFDKDKIFIGTEPRDTSLKSVELKRKSISFNYDVNRGQSQHLTRENEWYVSIYLCAYRCSVQDLDLFICILGKCQEYANNKCVKYKYSNAVSSSRESFIFS